MVKVKTSKYFQQLFTVFFMAVVFAISFGLIFKSWWATIVIPVFLFFYRKDINRSIYLIFDKKNKNFITGKYVFCGDIDLIKRMAERSKGIKEGRLSTARMTNQTYLFKDANKQDAQPINMSLYIPDSINYQLILTRILKNKDHKFTITFGEKSGIITELKA